MPNHIPHWVAALAALLLPSPLTLAKGALRMQLIPAIKTAIGVVGLAIVLAEDTMGPGSGADKKASAIAHVQAQLPALAESVGLPGVVVTLLSNEGVLGVVIDLLVSTANAAGHLGAPAPAEVAATVATGNASPVTTTKADTLASVPATQEAPASPEAP